MESANQNGNPNHNPTDRAWFCPACGSADITASSLAGGEASCNTCTWKGGTVDLPTFHFTHDMGTPEEVFTAFFRDVRKLLGQNFATPIGHMLIKWGFLDAPDQKNAQQVTRTLSRFIGSISKAVVVAIIEERRAMEKEKHRGQPPR